MSASSPSPAAPRSSQPATLDRAALVSAIDAFQMQIGTAVGNAIVLCLAELFPDHGIDLGRHDLRRRRRRRAAGTTRTSRRRKQITPVAPGSYDSAAIILLSDGRRTTGVDTLEAAKMAADRGVRIYVVGLGTVDGAAAGGRRHGDLPAPGRADPARGGAHDRRRVPPCRHGGEAAQRLPEPRLAPAGADARNRARAAAGSGARRCWWPGGGRCRCSGSARR